MKDLGKKILFSFLLFAFMLTGVPVQAAEKSITNTQSITVAEASEQPIIYKKTITVTENGGSYQIGFVNVVFKKEFIEDLKLPITFDVEIYCLNGQPVISFKPDVPDFYKKVHIKVENYSGLLYDATTQQNISVDIKKHQVLATHFSFWSLD